MEKNLQPKLRFPEFGGEWKSYKIGDLTAVKSASRVLKNQWVESGVPFFRTSDITAKYKGIENTKAFISMELFNELSKKSGRVKKDDLLVTGGGSIGLPYLIKTDEPLYFKDADLLWFKSTEELNGVFLYTYLTSDIFKTHLKSISHTGTISHYTIEQAKSTPIKIPVYQEQEKIASFLSSVDSKIEKLEKKKKLMSEYKKGAMQGIFSQNIRFSDENGEDYPAREEKKLGDMKTLEHGDGNWILSQDISENSDYKIVQLGNIGLGRFVEKRMKTISKDKFTEIKGTLIKKGDLLINRMVDSNVYCCLFNKYEQCITSVDVCWIRQNEFFNNYFLMNLMLHQKNQNKLLSLSSGSGRVRISKKNLFEKFIFKLPCLEEQEKIANFLSSIDKKIELVEKEIESNKEFKKGLLQQMFV